MLRETLPNCTCKIRLSLSQRAAFERRALAKDVLGTTKVHVGRRHVFERLVVTLVIVVVDKISDSLLKLPGEKVVVQADDILQGAMVALDFALGHGMERFATNVGKLMFLEECSQISR